MVAFIISYLLSLLFMNRALKNRNKLFTSFNHILAVFPPIFLLTFRAEDCGTDTYTYIMSYEFVETHNGLLYVLEARMEALYSLLMLCLKMMSLPVEFLFFVCGILTIVPVYIGSIKLKDKADPLITMALFYLMFYQYSFNISRQSIAMSFLFLAVVYLLENKKVISMMWGIVATLFHTVALFYFVIYFLYLFLEKSKIYTIVLVGVSLSFILTIEPDFFNDNVGRVQRYIEKGEAGMQMSYLCEMILNFIVVFAFYKKEDVELRRFFLIISGIVVFLILMSTRGPYIFRIANCADILLLLYVPITLKTANKKELYVGYMFFAVFFWWFVFIFNGSGRSYPYILSPILNGII